MPALDPTPATPTTLSPPIVTGCCARSWGSAASIYTDSMGMAGVTAMYAPGEAAVRAVKAGNDVVLHSPDDGAAFTGIDDGGEVGADRRGADRRLGRAHPAREGAGRAAPTSVVSVSTRLPTVVGTRAQPGGRRQRQRAIDHAAQGRAQPGAAEARRARRRCCISRCSTIRRAGGSPRRAGRSFRSCASAGRT